MPLLTAVPRSSSPAPDRREAISRSRRASAQSKPVSYSRIAGSKDIMQISCRYHALANPRLDANITELPSLLVLFTYNLPLYEATNMPCPDDRFSHETRPLFIGLVWRRWVTVQTEAFIFSSPTDFNTILGRTADSRSSSHTTVQGLCGDRAWKVRGPCTLRHAYRLHRDGASIYGG